MSQRLVALEAGHGSWLLTIAGSLGVSTTGGFEAGYDSWLITRACSLGVSLTRGS